ncbi:amino acid racemase [Gallaecimonas sp. GXIMD4217]|uniref:aspartate/glutamate racemase family protein n=1 Tax=Gallaecimonas sp. GXIMD4217 TaxID=3131927 RepID=UPI00311AECCB
MDKARHIGIVACSAEGAALCYRTICMEAPARMGPHWHPQLSLHGHPVGEYLPCLERDDWQGVGELMLSSANKLAAMGAELAICPDNTIHQAFDYVAKRSPIPWLHIAEVVADEAEARGYRRLAILGTRFLMTGPVYPQVLERRGIAWQIPDETDRAMVDAVIFEELVPGLVREASRNAFIGLIEKLAEQGCDAVVLGCTEIPLLISPDDSPLPVLDSTRLLARAALAAALRVD